MNNGSKYPRALSAREKEWLGWLLPLDRKGYREYRRALAQLLVIGRGRRGLGNLVLGRAGDRPDLASPLSPVFAYGEIDAMEGSISILIREESGGQIEVEMLPAKGEAIPETISEKSRWTYSTWVPGNPCPCCAEVLREVPVGSPIPQAVLAICKTDHRIWVYDTSLGVNLIIPITNFYNELMLHKNIREPEIALHPDYFFSHLSEFTDKDLVHAFVVYNKTRKKIESIQVAPPPEGKERGFLRFLSRIFNHSR